MKQKILLLSMLLLCLGVANAQWTGGPNTLSWRDSILRSTPTQTFTTTGAVTLSTPSLVGFFNSQANDTSQVLIRPGGGTFTLDDARNPNALTMVITSAVSKWGIIGIDSTNATSVAHLSFRIRFDSANGVAPNAGALLNLAIGNSDIAGTFFKGNNTIGTKPTATYNSLFTNLRFLYSSSGSPNYTLQYRASGSQTTTVNADISGGTVVSGVPYTFDVYCNDSTAAQSYTGPDGASYTVAPASFHLWENSIGVKKHLSSSTGPTVFDFQRCIDTLNAVGPQLVTMADNTQLNSFFFQGGGAAGASAIFDSTITMEYVTAASALPVSFITSSFTGQLVNKSVKLNWATASEQDNAYFEVLRSNDANTFTSIGEVTGNLTTSLEHKYSFADDNPNTGINYYKLEQVDIDGKGTYTNTIAVNDAAQQQNAFKVNVSGNQLNAIANVGTAGNAALQVFSVSGQKVVNTRVQLNQGENHFTVDVSSLQAGVYIAVINNNGKELSVEFIR